MPEESPMISRTSAAGSRSTDPCVTLDGRDGEQIQVLVRSPEPDDQALGLVLDCMTRAAADHSPWNQYLRSDMSVSDISVKLDGSRRPGGHQPCPVPRGIHLMHHDTLLKQLFPFTDITLICDPDSRDTVWGFSVSEVDCLHFIYVKSAFRRFGLGSWLLRETGLWGDEVVMSHRTPALYRAWPGIRWLWNPYRMMAWN